MKAHQIHSVGIHAGLVHQQGAQIHTTGHRINMQQGHGIVSNLGNRAYVTHVNVGAQWLHTAKQDAFAHKQPDVGHAVTQSPARAAPGVSGTSEAAH